MALNDYISDYKKQLQLGNIQRAYLGIQKFMSRLKLHLRSQYPDYSVSAVYPGYMDMTYVAVTPPALKRMKLKVALVYLHESGQFEAWLCGTNRVVQADYIKRLNRMDLGQYRLSQVMPGVDSIIESVLVENPDFEHPENLLSEIEQKATAFSEGVLSLLDQ